MRDKARPGERIARTGQWLGRRVNYRLGTAVYEYGVRRHGRALDRELDRRAIADAGGGEHVSMSSNARLALLFLSFALLTGFSRQLLGPVFDVVPKWATDTMSTVGMFLAVAAAALAVFAYRETPDRPPGTPPTH